MDNNFTSSMSPPVVKIFVPSITMRPWCVTVTRLLIRSIYCLLRASPAEFPNFCTIWRMNSDFYFLTTHFFKYTFNRFSITFFISFKYYFFINYLFFFYLTTIHLPTFFYSTPNYYNKKKAFEEWTVAHQTWWVGYCSWAKKKI